ncbi:MAG: hypothetical protein C5B50_11055 [Verrucomicrobia bacterium]|nr:MAG: hypothetical protein C5B50_11055 [Verrucomicrobiota bacterium]
MAAHNTQHATRNTFHVSRFTQHVSRFTFQVLAASLLTSCSSPRTDSAILALKQVQARYAPDPHLALFRVGIVAEGSSLVLTGTVDRLEAKTQAAEAVRQTGAKVNDQIIVLPSPRLGDKSWGISCLSVASGRELPEHKAEMGTQILMGNMVKLWDRTTNANFTWFLAQSDDGYFSWVEKGTIWRCTEAEAQAWQRSALVIVLASEDQVLEQPQADTQPVCDVVTGNVLKKLGEEGAWLRVQLADGREGYLPKPSTQDYAQWKQTRKPTPENIERTARVFLGRPYLWGGCSPKGLDCSGFVKLVFFLNGIELRRNASQQVAQGAPVPVDSDLASLRKGDLLFFGFPARREKSERITHVGIYLGNKLFIHSSELVRLASLDPDSPIRDEFRIRTLLKVRRVLPPVQS